MPELPVRFTTVPDWVCEVLSPSTRRYDVGVKRAFYARIGVQHLWYVDLEARALTVSRLDERARWVELDVITDGPRFRAEPFDAVEIDIGVWWEGL